MMRCCIVALGLMVAVAAISSCSAERPPLPRQIAFGDDLLEQKSHEIDGPVARTTYAAANATLPDARLQVEIHVGQSQFTVEELHRSVMDGYRATPGLRQYYLQTDSNRACALAGREAPSRSFVLLDYCSNDEGRTACAQAVDALGDEDVAECTAKGGACWNAYCETQWEAWRESLRRVAGTAGRAYSKEN